MTEPELQAIKATMPWTERAFHTNRGGLIQVVDNKGEEVSIFTMTKFLAFITHRLAQQSTTKEES